MSIENRNRLYPIKENPGDGSRMRKSTEEGKDAIIRNLQRTPSSDGVSFSEEKTGTLLPSFSKKELLEMSAENTPPTLEVHGERLMTISGELPKGSQVPAGFGFLNGKLFHIQLLELELEIYEDLVQQAKTEYESRIAQIPDGPNKENEMFRAAISIANGLIAKKLGATQNNEKYKQALGDENIVSMRKTQGVEVCLQKSLIAHKMIRELGHAGKSRICLESSNTPDEEGHAYCLVHLDGQWRARHPNMSHITDEGFAPRIEELSSQETAEMEYQVAV